MGKKRGKYRRRVLDDGGPSEDKPEVLARCPKPDELWAMAEQIRLSRPETNAIGQKTPTNPATHYGEKQKRKKKKGVRDGSRTDREVKVYKVYRGRR